MSQLVPLDAAVRNRYGKGPARATRRAGRVPCVIYGDKRDPAMISIDPKFLVAELKKPGFFIRQYEIKVNGNAERVLPRDVQYDPVSDRPLHVDFLRIDDKTKVNVEVPVRFINEEESPGLKRGGVLNVVRYVIEVVCEAGNIPDVFTFDLEGLEIGDSIHISSIELPEGIVPVISDRDFTIAGVAAPTVVSEEAAAEQAGVEEEEEGLEGIEGLEGEEGVEGEEGEAAEGEGETAEGEGEKGERERGEKKKD